jgi:hypothetical protein
MIENIIQFLISVVNDPSKKIDVISHGEPMLQGVVRTMIVIFIGRMPMLQGVVRTIIVIFIDRIPMLQGVVRTIIVIFIDRIPMLQGVRNYEEYL